MTETPRRKALLKLMLWGFFLMFVFFSLGDFRGDYRAREEQFAKMREESSEAKKKDTSLDKIKNYEYSYLLNINNKGKNYIYKVEGTYFNDVYYFTINNNNYAIKEDKVYLVDDVKKELKQAVFKGVYSTIDLRMLGSKTMNTIISSSEKIDSKEYNDGSTLTKYKYQNYDGKYMVLEVMVKDKVISNIKIDYTNYSNIKYDKYSIEINYLNINNLKSYDKDYSEYKTLEEGE